MENASKALIIAGAILLSILIIALGIYVFNMAKSATNSNSLSEVEIKAFNDPFTQYRGRKLGSEVVELIDKIVANISDNKEADDRLPDVVYIDGRSQVTAKNASWGIVDDATKDANCKAQSLGYCAGNIKGAIVSTSANTKSANMGSLRTKIAERHYYTVDYFTNEETGLIEYIFIGY